MDKNIKKLLLVNVFLAFADGIFYNFLELWLSSNNMSVRTISTVLSLASLITVSVIFLSSNIIKQDRLKVFVIILMGFKSIILTSLFILYKSNLNIMIKFLVMFEYAIDVEICACMYPLLSKINKNDKLYAKRKLLYEISYYIAAIISGILLGKSLSNLNITYNSYAIIGAISILIAALILITVKFEKSKSKTKDKDSDNVLFKVMKKIRTDKISINYLLFIVFNDISYYTLVGILMTILTNELGLSPTSASNVKLFFCVLSVGLATLILYKLTSKNNYINISIKYIGRVLFYFLACLFASKTFIVLGLAFTVLSSSCYAHVMDAPYINRFESSEQLAFANLCNMLGYFCKALGTLLCGFCITLGLRCNFMFALIFTSISTLFAYAALYYLNKERGQNDR